MEKVKVNKVNHVSDGIEMFLESNKFGNMKLVLTNEDLKEMLLIKLTEIVDKKTVKDFLELDQTSQEFYVLEPGEELNDERETNDRLDLEVDFSDRSIQGIEYELEIEKSCNFSIYLIPVIKLK